MSLSLGPFLHLESQQHQIPFLTLTALVFSLHPLSVIFKDTCNYIGPPGSPFHRFSEFGHGDLKLRGGGKQECLLYLTYLLMVLTGYCYWNELLFIFSSSLLKIQNSKKYKQPRLDHYIHWLAIQWSHHPHQFYAK